MSSTATVYALSDLAVLEFQGADALTFLHAQLTQDVLHLSPGQARLGAYCNAKGRVMATMIFWLPEHDTQSVRALVKADLVDALCQRLRMFVLRSKVSIQVLPLRVYGCMNTELFAAPALSDSATALQVHDNADSTQTWISSPHTSKKSTHAWLISADTLAEADTNSAPWHIADMQAGLPWVDNSAYESYIPQTLNLDLIDAVNFRKGCYPGQEVVARSHYRGTVKRRMAYACTKPDIKLEEGEDWQAKDTFLASSPDSPCGRIINAALHEGQLHVLMEVQLADLAEGEFLAGGAQGPALQVQALPYAIQAE